MSFTGSARLRDESALLQDGAVVSRSSGWELRYTFEWDPVKGKENLHRHKISFERAAELFLDPLAVSALDPEHSEAEE